MKLTAKEQKDIEQAARLRKLREERDKNTPKALLYESQYPDRIFDLDEEMPFGKYRGKLLADILNDNIDYITWLLENIKNFHLSEHAEAVYLTLLDPRRGPKAWES
jgi:uncharacterized protein (DUF3820 family)